MKHTLELLKRKFGPLPAWAWLLLLAGGVYWYRKRQLGKAAPSTADPTVAATPPATTDVSGDGSGTIYYPPGSTPPPGSSPPPTGNPPPVTTPPPAGYPAGYWQHHQHTEFGDNLWLYWNDATKSWMTVAEATAAGVPAPPSSYTPGAKYPPGSYSPGQAPAGANGQVVITAKSMLERHVTKPPVGPKRPRWEGPPYRITDQRVDHPQPQPDRPGSTAGTRSHRLRTITGEAGVQRQRQPVPTTTGVKPGSRDRTGKSGITAGPAGHPRHRLPAQTKTGSVRKRGLP